MPIRLAICYSTKDRPDLAEQSFTRIKLPQHGDLFWCDGSTTDAGRDMPRQFGQVAVRVTGGADVAIAWKLSKILDYEPLRYSHIMILEDDVLLDEDWFEPTMALFNKGTEDGLKVGAVSPRSYVDRILVQRDGYAVMHNIGAGVIIFTREAAEIMLRTFRTGWWPDNVRVFGQLSGIDLRTYAAFRGNEQWVTCDWNWEVQLARHGLASLALTPAKCRMIGQDPPLEQQGLHLTGRGVVMGRWEGYSGKFDDERAFVQYRDTLKRLGPCVDGIMLSDGWSVLHRDGAGLLVFAHQIGNLVGSSWQGTLESQRSQGYGPFAYRAGPDGASLSVHISGSASFQCSGGRAGARVTIEDHRSGFKSSPMLPPGNEPISIVVPGGPIPRLITMQLDEGAVFYALACSEPQMIDTTWRFDWKQLPEAK